MSDTTTEKTETRTFPGQVHTGWPEWLWSMTDEDLQEMCDALDHDILPVHTSDTKGWVCGYLHGGQMCRMQVQKWGEGWWHVDELIGYSWMNPNTRREAMAEIIEQTLADDEDAKAVLGDTPEERIAAMVSLWDGWE